MEQTFLDVVYEIVGIKELHTFMEVALKNVRSLLDADAGSIFLYNEADNSLIFKYTQNDTIEIPFKEFSMPLDEQSIAGYAGVHNVILNIKDAYKIGPSEKYKFNHEFDSFSGYRTKSIITIPLTNRKNELIGIFQLINKRSYPYYFTENDEVVCNSLSGIIAATLENSLLYDEIESMWEGFIKASIQAIESRDPVTRGHTERVTNLTLKVATEVANNRKLFPDFTLTSDQYTMLKYASLLHDFGKIGVREEVLQKAKKLSDDKLEKLKYKIAFAKLTSSNHNMPEDTLDIIERLNEPSVLEENFETFLDRIKDIAFVDPNGNPARLLDEYEYLSLSVKKGSLTEEERKEMEKHVLYTYLYLSSIPWTKELKDVPKIACQHHEKLDGTGYPFGLKGEQIHPYGRIMAIADIFDALTAKDRPYKKAVPVEIALNILRKEAEDNKLDMKYVSFFIEKKLYT